MLPWCVVLVCSWWRLLADCHSLSFPWSLSLHRRRCPLASHHPVSFLFLFVLSFPLLPFPFPSLFHCSVSHPHTHLVPLASHLLFSVVAGRCSLG